MIMIMILMKMMMLMMITQILMVKMMITILFAVAADGVRQKLQKNICTHTHTHAHLKVWCGVCVAKNHDANSAGLYTAWSRGTHADERRYVHPYLESGGSLHKLATSTSS